MTPIPAFVISREKDIVRREKFTQFAAEAQLIFKKFPAIDASIGPHVFRPYIELIGDSFWGDDEVKPGAIGCFLSHYRLWQDIANHHANGALVFEDDAQPLRSFWELFPIELAKKSPLIFFNNRMQSLSRGQTITLNAALNHRVEEKSENLWGDKYRAPGADGYYLSQNAARQLIEAVNSDRIQVGVDWYLLYASFDSRDIKHRDVKHLLELKKIHKIFGRRAPLFDALISEKPLSFVDSDAKSTIQHRNRLDMTAFKASIMNSA